MRPVDREWVPPGIAPVTVRIMPAPARPLIAGRGRFRRLRRGNRLCGLGCGSGLRGFGGGRHDRGPRHADRRRLARSCCRCGGRTSGRRRSGGILGMAAEGGSSDKKRCDGQTHNTRLHLNDPLSLFGGHGPGLARANWETADSLMLHENPPAAARQAENSWDHHCAAVLVSMLTT